MNEIQLNAQEAVIKLWQETFPKHEISSSTHFFETLHGAESEADALSLALEDFFNTSVPSVVIWAAPTPQLMTDYLLQHYPTEIAKKFGVTIEKKEEGLVNSQMLKVVQQRMVSIPTTLIPPKKNKPAIFILSPPRSGSTLFRKMLEQHSGLFAPPELHLMGFNSLDERKKYHKGFYSHALKGTIIAVQEAWGVSQTEAERMMLTWEQEGITTADFYKKLQDKIDSKMLVDKSPVYTADPKALERMELYFENPLYIHLVRHPYAGMRSFAKARFDRLYFRGEHEFTPQQLGEMIWTISHQNILSFLAGIPQERQLMIKYEDLVTAPQEQMEILCRKLNLPFEKALINPYQKKHSILEAGEKGVSDYRFFQQQQIDPNLAHTWKKYYNEDILSDEAYTISQKFNYEIPQKANWQENRRYQILELPLAKTDTHQEAYAKVSLKGDALTPLQVATAFQILLYKYSRAERITTGSLIGENTNDIITEWNGRTTVKEIQATLQQQLTIPNNTHVTMGNRKKLQKHQFWCHWGLFEGSGNFDLLLSAQPTFVELHSSVYPVATLQTVLGHFVEIIKQLPTKTTVRAIAMVTATEQEQILHVFNSNKTVSIAEPTILSAFESQVKKHPHKLALKVGQTSYTYYELNQKAEQLGAYLQTTYQLQTEDRVGIFINRNEYIVIAMLGVLKTGAAYVNIDPKSNAERRNYICQEASIKVLLSEQDGIGINIHDENIWHSDSVLKPVQLLASHLAYIIFTSGSTGHPKGVLLEHQSVMNLVQHKQNTYGFNETDITPQLFSFHFAGMIEQVWLPLLSGAKMIIVDMNTMADPNRFDAFLKKEKVTHLHAVPPFLKTVKVTAGLPLKRVTTGADTCPPDLAQRWLGKVDFFHIYGSTEATMVAVTDHIKEVTKGQKRLPVGKAIQNMGAYILEEGTKHLQAVGLLGEVCFSGVGLARGYLNQPKLTDEKFIPNPFKDGERLYRTGDIGRLLPNGKIELLGRKDYQLKIRGFRVEPQDVEHHLLKHTAVKDVIVVGNGKLGEKELVAYVVASKKVDTATLRSYLDCILPEYMIPSYFVFLDQLPLNRNGKKDRLGLSQKPLPQNAFTLENYEALSTETEKFLAQAWQEILTIERVGRNDNFLHLGGHSIKAIQLINKIQQQLSCALNITDIFRHSVLKSLAKYIEQNTAIIDDIPQTTEATYYPVSNAQRRLWVLHQFEEAKASYNITRAFTLKGDLDLEVFKQAVQRLIARHESLRTNFQTVDGHPVQVIHNNFETRFLVEENITPAALLQREISYEFDFENEPLFRVVILNEVKKQDRKAYTLIINMHHIISDGWSMGVLFKNLMELYNATVENRAILLPKLSIQYKDYAVWQNQLLESEAIRKHRAYWYEQLSGEIPALDLPTDFPRPIVKTYHGSHAHLNLTSEVTTQLKELCKEQDATLFSGLVALLNALLFRYTAQTDIAIGTVNAGRVHQNLEHQIGFYVNTLVLRNQLSPNHRFEDLLQEVKHTSMHAMEHEIYPYDKLVEEIGVARDTSRSPFFDVLLVLQNNKFTKFELSGLAVAPYPKKRQTSHFDLSFEFIEKGEELLLTIEYNTDLFKEERILRMLKHFEALTRSVIDNPRQKVATLNILPETEKQQLLVDFSNTKTDYPKDKTIVELFEAQVEKTPNHIALIFQNERITYKVFNAKANALAKILVEKGVQKGDFIPILMENCLDVPLAMMAIMKAGAAFVPISAKLPPKRIQQLLLQINAKLVLTHPATETLHFGHTYSISLHQLSEAKNLSFKPLAKDAIYAIFTSGSTGVPKAAINKHQGITNRLCYMNRVYGHSVSEAVLQTTPHYFDSAVWQYFWPLITGGKSILSTEQERLNLDHTIDLIAKEQVSCIDFVPTLFNEFVEYFSTPKEAIQSLKQIIVGGEKAQTESIRKLRYQYPKLGMTNAYGPTETSIGSIFYEIGEKVPQNIPIGQPIDNVKAYILDQHCQLVPIGVAGEIHIGGDAVGLGYLNNPEKTNEAFIANPFKEGEKIYKTGDLGRWLPDGNIEYLGRIDHQVKVRGYRIELGEIEHQLGQHQAIKEQVVLAKAINGQNELVAYVVLEAEQEFDVGSLRSHLAESLPNYMIPANFIKINQIPLTANGKIDRKKLVALDLNTTSLETYEAPTTATEQVLAQVWQEVLGIEKVSRNDDFFQLGGNSITGIRLVTLLQKQGELLSIRALFESPVLKDLAQKLRSSADSMNTQHQGILLNQLQSKKAFFFPGALGMGLVFADMAKEIRHASIIAFDFIESEDRIQQYIQQILEQQPKGPYVLGAYSAGGVLAFEVAKSLEKMGHQVSDLILLDAVADYTALDGRNKQKRALFYENYIASVDAESLELIKVRRQAYQKYYENHHANGQLSADVHYLIAVDSPKNWEQSVTTMWQNRTKGSFKLYQGSGQHHDMLKDTQNIVFNAALVSDILKEVKV